MALVVEPLVSYAVEKLGTLLMEEAVFLVSVRGQVTEMIAKLTKVRSFLIDADRRRRAGDASVSHWVVEIRELAYDAEDAIATFVVSRRLDIAKKLVICHGVGTNIRDISGQIDTLMKDVQTYGLQATAIAATRPRTTYATVADDGVVGLDDDIKTVVAHLKDKTHSRIISIWGMGGVGKTTFSKEIFRHREIRRDFDYGAWVCVSQQCKPDQVWRDVLLHFFDKSDKEKKKIKDLTQDGLVRRLHSLQKEKKCLVILDDLWEQEDWSSLRPAFSRVAENGSKIVITTRNKAVVSHSHISCFLYKLPLLTKEECLKLLKNKLSTQEQGFELMSIKMKKLVEEIAEKCSGLPLAVVLLGGLLEKEKTLEAWKKVHDDANHYLNQGNDQDGGVSEVLALSYQDLPHHLKACFLYLSLFPKDYRIEAKPLVQMWIAEGFVQADESGESERKTTLYVGLSYLDELANRCMIEVERTTTRGLVRYIHLHDLMRSFCVSKAREENFSQDLGPPQSDSSKIRRIAVHVEDDSQQQEVSYKQHQPVRSCFIRLSNDCDKQSMTGGGVINSLLKGFKVLKVFKVVRLVKGPNEGKLSKDIGKLIHLRYLSIPGVKELPLSLGNLIYLQTLDICSDRRQVSDAISVPDVLWKLKELQHLYLPNFSTCSTKLRLAGLSKLETLMNFDTRFSDVEDLATMPNLRQFRILCQVKELKAIFAAPMFSVSNNIYRQFSFSIKGAAETQEEHDFLCQVLASPHLIKIHCFFTVIEETFLHNLNPKITHVELFDCKLKEDPMPILGKLPTLRTIVLGRNSYIGKEIVCSEQITAGSTSIGYFPQLKRLVLDEINISEWKMEKGPMRCLTRLRIVNCKKLKEIPDGLRSITTLQYLQVSLVNESLKQRLQPGGHVLH